MSIPGWVRGAAAVVAVALVLPALHAGGQVPDSSYKSTSPDTLSKRTFDGFVDTYYAWDFDRPHTFDRAYTTQPARHAEFNVNLAFVEMKVTGPRYRGRLALQWGTSVQANYAGEPKLGSVSGPSVSQFIQEASAGYQLAPTLWLDGGIFFAHVGYESWISRDNLSYTRSMVADFSPYYEAGVKLTWTASSKVTATAAVVNGWQDISVYNTPPAGGIRIDYTPTDQVTLTYDNFVGNATADTVPVHLRVYHDAIAQYNPKGPWQLAAVYALGSQSRTLADGGAASWWGFTSIAKYHATPTLSVVARGERYSDPNQVIIVTGLPSGFVTTAGSIGVDVNFQPPVLWRTEFRAYRPSAPVWPLNRVGRFGANDSFIVSSLALTF